MLMKSQLFYITYALVAYMKKNRSFVSYLSTHFISTSSLKLPISCLHFHIIIYSK
jgi:hypothetical protein